MAFGLTAHVHLAIHGRAGIAGGVTDALFGHEIAHIWECAIVPGVRCGEREQEEGTVEHRLMCVLATESELKAFAAR